MDIVENNRSDVAKSDSSNSDLDTSMITGVYDRYLQYLVTGELSDITFTCPSHENPSEKVTFRLHTLVVAARSPVLALAIQTAQNGIISLSTRADVFQGLVWAMYTDALKGMPEHLMPEIAWAAQFYQVRIAEFWALQYVRHTLAKKSPITLANEFVNGFKVLCTGPLRPSFPTNVKLCPEALQHLIHDIRRKLNKYKLNPAALEETCDEISILIGPIAFS